MKKLAVSILAIGAMGAWSQAFAQSSVTLYGILDESVQWTHNVGGQSNQIKLQTGQFQVSQWGLKGSEDLGGGLKTIFDLQSGFDINNGKASSGLEFSRRAFVGLSDDKYGTVTFGRSQDVLQDLVGPVQPDNFMEYFTAPGDVDNADGVVRYSSAVKWESPVWAGLQMGAMYSFGGIAGSMGSGSAFNGAVNYTVGNLAVAAGIEHDDNGNAVLSQRGTTAFDSPFISVVNSAYVTASKINIARAGLSYAIGTVTVGGYYSYSEYLADGASTFKNAERYNNGAVYAFWQATPAASFEVGYDYMKSHGDSSATYNQVTVAADYNLSKRTDVYMSASYGRASGQNGLGPAQAVIADTYADAGAGSQQIVMVGIRHHF